MRLWLFGVISVFLVATSDRAKATTYKPHHLYRVEIGGNTSWVLGTMHVKGIEIEMIEGLAEALGASQSLMVEVDSLGQEPDVWRLMRELGGMDSPRSLVKLLDRKPFDRYQRFVRRTWPEHQQIQEGLLGLRPGAAALVILVTAISSRSAASVSLQNEFDGKIQAQARSLGLPILELDALQTKLSYLLKTVTAAHLADLIRELIEPDGQLNDKLRYRHEEGIEERLRSEVLAYLEGSYRPIPSDDFALRLLVKRDVMWLEPMLQEMQKRPSFLAVGLTHLHHSTGLLASLRSRGAKITPAVSLMGVAARTSSCQSLFR